MSPAPDYTTCRIVPYAARNLLRESGYLTARLTSPDIPVDLLAWKNRDNLLFVRTRSSRVPVRANHYGAEVRSLSRMAGSNCPGDVELWIRTQSQWDRYRIMSGGAYAVPEGVHGL